MNMPTLSPAAPVATELPPVNLAPRQLTDDVFQTAEEAVLAEGQTDPFADTLPPTSAREADVAARPSFSLATAIQSHVAARPCQSALLAAAAGALAAIVLRSQLRGRIPAMRPSWFPSKQARRALR
jgi:hypothetical protein